MPMPSLKKIFSPRALFESRFWALLVKETRQLLTNRQLLFLLLFPPTIQLCLYGLVLSPNVKYLRLGVVDHAKVPASRELIAALTENKIFIVKHYLDSQQALGRMVENGQLNAGMVIPPDFNRRLKNKKSTDIQFFLDGVDAYSAGISASYISQILYNYNQQYLINAQPPRVQTQVIYLYNPGLLGSWFFIPGVMGVLMTFTSSQASSVESIREKDTGTLEQLLMTPASSEEIILAKVLPLFVLLMGSVLVALNVAHWIFSVPIRGNVFLYLFLAAVYILICIGIGLFLATVSKNKQQVILTGFFINLPIIQLSGALSPIESMPVFFHYFTLINPLSHFIITIRGILLKGVGLEILWPHVLTLIIFAIVIMAISVRRYRTQLG